jgi:hypothetical protein
MMGNMTIMRSLPTFQAMEVRAMTDLTANQLREWTARRGILPADHPSLGRGRHARYSWASALTLRILAQLFQSYRVELSFWRDFATNLRDDLSSKSALSLSSQTLWINDSRRFSFLETGELPQGNALIGICLREHIFSIAAASGTPLPVLQPDLFRVVSA